MSIAAPNFESNSPASIPPVSVVLCCTAGDVEAITELSQALRERRNAAPQVVLLEGEQLDELKTLAASNVGQKVLYVLCRSREMSVTAIQQVRNVLRGNAGGQFMTVQVSTVERMESALAAALSGPRFSQPSVQSTPAPQSVLAANSRPPRRGGGLPGPRGMVTNPPVPPSGSAPPRTLLGAAPPPQGSVDAPRTMMGAAPPPEGPTYSYSNQQGPQTLMGVAPAAQVHSSSDGGPRTMMGAAPPPEGSPALDQGPGTMMGAAPPPEGPAFVLNPHAVQSAPGLGGSWANEDEASISGSATVMFGDEKGLASGNWGNKSWEQWLAMGQQAWQDLWKSEGRNLKLGIAGGLVLFIPLLTMLLWFGLRDSDKGKDEPQKLAASEQAPSVVHAVQGEGELSNLEQEPPVEEEKVPTAQAAQPNAAVAQKNKAEPQKPAGVQEVGDAVKYREYLRVEAAMRRSSIRGLDSLIIDTSKSRKYSFRSARRYCNRKESAKLSGWRLPSGDELSRVADANMLNKGSFWAQPNSRSRSRHAYVWDGKRKKLVKKSAKYRGARALCVRDRVSVGGR